MGEQTTPSAVKDFLEGNQEERLATVVIAFKNPDRFPEVLPKLKGAFDDTSGVKVALAVDDIAREVMTILTDGLPGSEEESNLLAHAKRELELSAEDDEEFKKSILAAVKGFVSYPGHSGGSHMAALQMLSDLLQFKNLSPITDDPEEWLHVAEEIAGSPAVWQSRRNPEIFSTDGGKTHYLLSEGGKIGNPDNVIHRSAHKEV